MHEVTLCGRTDSLEVSQRTDVEIAIGYPHPAHMNRSVSSIPPRLTYSSNSPLARSIKMYSQNTFVLAYGL